MGLRIVCPSCGKLLGASEKLIGRQVECTGCRHRFRVSPPAAEDAGSAQQVSASAKASSSATQKTIFPAPPPSGSNREPDARPVPPGGSGEDASRSVPPSRAPQNSNARSAPRHVEHVSMGVTPAGKSRGETDAPPENRAGNERNQGAPPAGPLRPAGAVGKTTFPAPPPQSQAPPPSAPSPPPPPTPPSSSLIRRSNQAKFVPADTKTDVHLGADGTLPSLHLDEPSKKPTPDESQNRTNPALLMGVLAVSLALTLMLLLADTSPQVDTTTKDYAREQIETHYLSRKAPFEPYEELLRKALQAHAQGKLELERDYYRRVLDMLNAEDKNRYRGLTGVPDATEPPNDRHLQETLTRLIAP